MNDGPHATRTLPTNPGEIIRDAEAGETIQPTPHVPQAPSFDEVIAYELQRVADVLELHHLKQHPLGQGDPTMRRGRIDALERRLVERAARGG